MNDFFQDIIDFHVKFGLSYDGPPRDLPPDMYFRRRFLREELDEYLSAANRAEQLDGLVDLAYVVLGTAYVQGFDFREAWRRVHEANMRKVRAANAEQSTRNSSFDVIKPPGWTQPDLFDLA